MVPRVLPGFFFFFFLDGKWWWMDFLWFLDLANFQKFKNIFFCTESVSDHYRQIIFFSVKFVPNTCECFEKKIHTFDFFEKITSVGKKFHRKKNICLKWSETDSVQKKYFWIFWKFAKSKNHKKSIHHHFPTKKSKIKNPGSPLGSIATLSWVSSDFFFAKCPIVGSLVDSVQRKVDSGQAERRTGWQPPVERW